MTNRRLIALLLLTVPFSGCATGSSSDRSDIQPVKRGSAANPNSAYSAPQWDNEPRLTSNAAPKKAVKPKAGAKKVVPDEPTPAATSTTGTADGFPDYAAPEPKSGNAVTVPVQATPKDSLEPPLPDEPGGDPDKRPSK